MTRSSPILCGGAPAARSPGSSEPLRLDLQGSGQNVNLKISDVSQAMVSNVPDVLLDLVELAAYVYAADQAVGRGGPPDVGDLWRRRFEFGIAVRRPDIWSSAPVTSALVEALGLLSEDNYEFRFTRLDSPPPTQLYFEDFAPQFDADEVALFSGGLDSLAGAIHEGLGEGRRVALVSHRSAPKRKRQLDELVKEVQGRCPAGSILHVPVWANKDSGLGREYTQRTRSFLYAALATAVATMLGRSRIRFYENGVTSLNLPISPQVVGARATRTTHPQVIGKFGTFFSALLDRPFAVESPFIWKTKKDIVQLIAQHGCADLIRRAISCSHTVTATRLNSHCGECAQCIDRRFAILAAGLADEDPPEQYKVDLLTGERHVGDARTMIESYVRTATEVANMSDVEFFSKFGEASRVVRHLGLPSGEAGSRILDLCQRHVKGICRVVDDGIKSHATELREGKLPPSCLLVLATNAPYRRTPSPDEPVAPTFRREGQFWTVQFENETARLKDSVPVRHVARLLGSPHQEVHSLDLLALAAGQPVLPAPGSAGAASDGKSIREYAQRLQDYDEEIREAEKDNDLGRLTNLRDDREQLAQHIMSVTGLNREPRSASDDSEHARQTISVAVGRCLKVLDKHHPPLARHLRKFLKRGRLCSYRPEPPITWIT